MTVIKLDAATFAKVRAGDPVFLSDETGEPLVRIAIFPKSTPLDREPTEDELDEAEHDTVDYPLSEAWEKIRRGEKL